MRLAQALTSALRKYCAESTCSTMSEDPDHGVVTMDTGGLKNGRARLIWGAGSLLSVFLRPIAIGIPSVGDRASVNNGRGEATRKLTLATCGGFVSVFLSRGEHKIHIGPIGSLTSGSVSSTARHVLLGHVLPPLLFCPLRQKSRPCHSASLPLLVASAWLSMLDACPLSNPRF